MDEPDALPPVQRAFALGFATAKAMETTGKGIETNPFPPTSPQTVAFLRGFQTGSP